MQIDAHLHFWRYQATELPWLTEPYAELRRDFLPVDVESELSLQGFDGCVAVPARQSLAETRWLLELSDDFTFLRGVIGWVDLCSSDVEAQLDLFVEHPRFVGVRHAIREQTAPDLLSRESFQTGVAQLGRRRLACDLRLFPDQLRAAAELAERNEATTIVLDHLGKPPLGTGRLARWRDDLHALAERPNVCAKLSGLVTEADWERWRPAELRPLLEVALEAFGPERLIFGSDWPMCLVAANYNTVAQTAFDFAEALSPAERASLLGGNAARLYGLPD